MVAYDGATFAGWARQPTQRTVSGELDGAIRALDPRATLTRGVSRTDTGVHARAQLVSFDTDADIDPRGWALGLMPHLPREIAVVRAARVEAGYDPRRYVRNKTYRYVLLQSVVPDPFWLRRAWRVRERLNHPAMREELADLLGEHDFRAFRSARDERPETVRRMLRAELRTSTDDARIAEILVTGDRFMHRMMRIICGTLVDVGRGRLPPHAVRRALASGKRDDLGMTAPADGLYLEHIELDDAGSDAWPD
jgi:tRNA pseudouridine38-40 synthase